MRNRFFLTSYLAAAVLAVGGAAAVTSPASAAQLRVDGGVIQQWTLPGPHQAADGHCDRDKTKKKPGNACPRSCDDTSKPGNACPPPCDDPSKSHPPAVCTQEEGPDDADEASADDASAPSRVVAQAHTPTSADNGADVLTSGAGD